MAKIEQAIELIEENPFRSIDEICQEVGLEKDKLVAALDDNNISLTELKNQAQGHMSETFPQEFAFNFNEMYDIDGDDK